MVYPAERKHALQLSLPASHVGLILRAERATAVSMAGPGGSRTQTSSDGSGFGAQTMG
jgi:hypothetical protein